MLLLYIAAAYFALDFILVLLKHTCRPRRTYARPQKKSKTVQPVDNTKMIKILEQINLAQLELEQLDARREIMLAYYEILENEYSAETTTQTRQAQIKKEILKLDDKLEQLDFKRAKTYSKIKILDAA